MAIFLLNSNLGGYAYVAFIVVSYVYGIYNSLQVSITFNKIINMFHSRMNVLAKWIRGCMQLYQMQVCFCSTELAPTLSHIRGLLGDELIQMLLGDSVFMQEPGLISDKGVIIKCFRLFLDAKKQGRDIIAPFARYVAHIDVFTGLGTWLREQDDRCPARFILDANTPTIQGTDLWNLACRQPIYNNVSLGGTNNTPDENTSSAEINMLESRPQKAIDNIVSDDNSDSSKVEKTSKEMDGLEGLDELEETKDKTQKEEQIDELDDTKKEFQDK
jgi:hypothetical protein